MATNLSRKAYIDSLNLQVGDEVIVCKSPWNNGYEPYRGKTGVVIAPYRVRPIEDFSYAAYIRVGETRRLAIYTDCLEKVDKGPDISKEWFS